jgi:flagellar hook protein FlgE
MNQAFYSGISGLKNYSTGIDVLSDNLANAQTTGFRAYEAEYASLFEETLASTSASLSDSIGAGVTVQATGMDTSQGTIIATDRSLDVALSGDGWFGIAAGEEGKPVYTRDGAFGVDANANLVTADGFYVLGSMANNIDENNVLTQQLETTQLGAVGTQGKLTLPPTLTFPTKPSTKVDFIGNLGLDPEPVSMGSAVIDAQSNRNNLELVFTKDENQVPPGVQYNVVAQVTSADGSVVYDTQEGRVTFDEQGALINSTLSTIDNNGTPLNINLGESFNGIIAVNSAVTSSSAADGTMGGDLVEYNVDGDGDIIASFSNGEQSSIGKLAVYHFQNDQGLSRINGSRFEQSPNSGDALFYKDANGNNVVGTQISNFNLESSNVDMTVGLTELIILQRSYDANSKSVTTADEMIQKALDMDA